MLMTIINYMFLEFAFVCFWVMTKIIYLQKLFDSFLHPGKMRVYTYTDMEFRECMERLNQIAGIAEEYFGKSFRKRYENYLEKFGKAINIPITFREES